MHAAIPCTFAGMPGGCTWHRERYTSNIRWVAEPFQLSEAEAPMPKPGNADGVELVPVYKGKELHFETPDGTPVELEDSASDIPMKLEDLIGISVRNYLNGCGMSDVDV